MACGRRVRARVSHSGATENTYTPARMETLLELSVVIILSHLHEFPHFRLVVVCSLR